MPETLTGVVLLLAFLVPGFVLEHATRRATLYKPRSDLDFVVRGIVLSLIVHLFFFPWTARIVEALRDEAAERNRAALAEAAARTDQAAELALQYNPPLSALDVWQEQRWELFVYAVTVLAIAPVLLGALAGWRLRQLEFSSGKRPWWADVLGARLDPPRAWDALPSTLGDGGFVVARMRESGNVVGGRMGQHSTVNLRAEPDLLIEELWWLDEYGNPLSAIEPRRAAWLGRDQLESLVVIPAEELPRAEETRGGG